MDKRAIRLFVLFALSLTCDLLFGLSLSEQPIKIDGPAGPIRGVLTQLKDHGDHPTIPIIPGSGSTDLDGNSKYGINSSRTSNPNRVRRRFIGSKVKSGDQV